MSTKYPGGIIPAVQSYSVLTTGTGYLRTTGNSAFAIPTANTPFTVEAWIYPLANGNAIFSEQVTGAGNPCALACSLATAVDVGTTGGVRPAFGWYNGTAWTTAAATDAVNAVVLRRWTHLAFVFTGSTSKIYKNGIDVTSATPTPQTSWGITTANGENWYVGKRWDGTAGFNGYMSNFRFVNGTAVYTSNFNPPGILEAIPNTVLLTNQYATIRDGSSNNFSLQPFLGAAVSDFTHFSEPIGYDPAIGFNPALGGTANGVWTLDQVTNARQLNTWPAYDPYYNYDVVMINGNGENGANNNTFIDSGPNNFPITQSVSSAQGTFSPFSKNGWSVAFEPTALNYYSITNASSGTTLQMNTGDFTFETWFTYNGSVLTNPRYFMSKGTASNVGLGGYIFNSAGPRIRMFINGTNYTASTFPIETNNWYHVAFVRQGTSTTNVKLYINGVLYVTSTVANLDNLNQTADFRIGNTPAVVAAGQNWGGRLSNYRLVKGVAVYTAAFTPPTQPLTAITGTALLTFQNGTIKDNSVNNQVFIRTSTNTLTAGGIQFTPQAPFNTGTIYNPEIYSGSLGFPAGVGAVQLTFGVSSSALAFGTGADFTAEFFFYIKGSITVDAVTFFDISSSGAALYVTKAAASGALQYGFFATTGNIATTTVLNLASDQWNHVAVCRASGVIRSYFNGVLTSTNANTNSLPAPTNGARIGGPPSFTGGYMTGVRMLINTALYTGSTITVPTAPLTAIANTAFLLNGNNAGILDYASNDIATVGGIQVTTTQSKWGFGSLLCSRTSGVRNVLVMNSAEPIELLTGDYTIEFQIYPSTFTVTDGYILAKDGIAGTNYPQYSVRMNSVGNILYTIGIATGATTVQTATGTVPLLLSAWNHVAITKFNNTITVFVRGIVAITFTQTITSVYVGRPLTINGQTGSIATAGFDGYLNDIRITKSYARYIGSFQPPTSALQGQ